MSLTAGVMDELEHEFQLIDDTMTYLCHYQTCI